MKFAGQILLAFIIGVFGGVVFLIMFGWRFPTEEPGVNSAVKEVKEIAKTEERVPAPKVLATSSASVEQKKVGLEEVVRNSISKSDDTFGIAIRNLKTGETYSFNDDRKFTAASFYKIWVMAEVFRQVETGKIDLSDRISADVAKLNENFQIASEAAELTEGGFTYTISDALAKMISVSDNYAAMMLLQKVRLSNVKKLLQDYEFINTTVGDSPTTTPDEVAYFYELLYKNKLVDEKTSQEMMSLLLDQQLNYLLPKYLPQFVKVAHKTGQYGRFTHDGGIVFSESGDYIIVLMAETDDTKEVEERMAKLSKNVYEYFQSD